MSGETSPGPWTLSDDPVRRVIKDGSAKPRTVCIIESWTTEPDARLIAAAPALRDALRKAAGVISGETTTKADLIAALEATRAALKQAGAL